MVRELLDAYDVEEIKTMAAAHFWPHSRQAGDMSDDTGVKLVVPRRGLLRPGRRRQAVVRPHLRHVAQERRPRPT